jgi:hypothetical protein
MKSKSLLRIIHSEDGSISSKRVYGALIILWSLIEPSVVLFVYEPTQHLEVYLSFCTTRLLIGVGLVATGVLDKLKFFVPYSSNKQHHGESTEIPGDTRDRNTGRSGGNSE